MIQKIKQVTLWLSLCLLVVMAISISLVRLFLLSVDDYKVEIKSKIFELTEMSVDIGKVQANMRGFTPGIILKDVRVLSSNGKPSPIKFAEIRFSISLFEMLWAQQLLPASRLTLVGAKLSVIRMKDGRLSIIGLNSNDSTQPDWLLNGGRYAMLDSEITWLDQQRHTQPLRFQNVDLLLKTNIQLNQHQIHFIGLLPESIGESVRVSMQVQGNIFEKNNINGLIYIKGRNIELAQAAAEFLPLELKIKKGKASFELWSEWEKSKNIALTGGLQIQQAVIKKHKQRHIIDSLSAKFTGANLASGWQFFVSEFKLKTGVREWQAASFGVAGNHELTQLAVVVKQLELQPINELLLFAPLNKEYQSLLSQLNIKGQIKDFSSYLDTVNKTFAINGEVNNLFTSPTANTPQIKNFSASVYGTDQDGVVGINTQHASVFLPDLFRQAIPVNKLSGILRWQQAQEQWLITAENLTLNVKDAQTNSNLKLVIHKNDTPIFMDLQSTLTNIEDVSAIPNYYPAKIMSKDALSWLDSAFVAGEIKTGRMLFVGNLNAYPFSKGDGVFDVVLDASDVELQFAPNWPHLHNVNAEISFQQDGLIVTSNHAEATGIKIFDTAVEIPHLGKSTFVLVKGKATATTRAGLIFLQKTPLHHIANNLLDIAEPAGNVEVSLETKVPLSPDFVSKVEGEIKLNKAALNIKAMGFNISEIEGNLRFSKQGLFAEKLAARALDSPISISIDTRAGNTMVSATGKARVSQLKKQFDFLNHKTLENKVKGAFNYQVLLDLPSKKDTAAILTIATNLIGVSIDLPGRLRKSSAEKKQLGLKITLNQSELLPLSLNLNDDIKAELKIGKKQKQLYSANIVYGTGVAKIPKNKAINIIIKQPVFNLVEWAALLKTDSGAASKPNKAVKNVSIQTKNLKWGRQSYGVFDLQMNFDGRQWNGRLNNSLAKGRFVTGVKHPSVGKTTLYMEYINFSALMALSSEGRASKKADFPLIDIFSEQLLWKGEDLGKLAIKTIATTNGVKFESITLLSNDFKVSLAGDWLQYGKDSLTTFQGELTSDNMGKVLSKLDMSQDIAEGEGSVSFFGEWPGAPYQFSLGDVEATIELELNNGRITSVEPGFGRALGFLAAGQWLKRLQLDFGDLYKKGLSFNSISGLFTIEQGAAHTNRLFVDSIPAQITVSGDTDLLTKTLDFNIVVVPKSSEAVPIAGTIIDTIATPLTQILVSDYKEGYYFGSTYQATGNWGDIKLKALHKQGGVFTKTWTGLTGLFRGKTD